MSRQGVLRHQNTEAETFSWAFKTSSAWNKCGRQEHLGQSLAPYPRGLVSGCFESYIASSDDALHASTLICPLSC